MVTSFCTSPSSIFEMGMPVHLLTILATSSSSTSSLSIRDCLVSIWALSCLMSASSFGSSPYCNWAAFSYSPLRVVSCTASLSCSNCSFLARTLAMDSFSCFQRTFRALASSLTCASSFSATASRSRELTSSSRFNAWRSISS